MNERIKELAEQATVLDYSTWDSHNQRTKDHYKFDKEKFAELIVKECYESCRSQVLDKETADTNELTYNDAVGDCAIGLLQHFEMME